jgi:hypothetical protein
MPGTQDMLHARYTTADGAHRICPACFDDFHKSFASTVLSQRSVLPV